MSDDAHLYLGTAPPPDSHTLPDDTFTDEDRETAQEWRESLDGLDLSDTWIPESIRSPVRPVQAAGNAAGNVVGSVVPWWAKYAVGGVVLIALLAVLSPYAEIGATVAGTVTDE